MQFSLFDLEMNDTCDSMNFIHLNTGYRGLVTTLSCESKKTKM